MLYQSLNVAFGDDSLDRWSHCSVNRMMIATVVFLFILDHPLISRNVPLLLLSGHKSAHPQFATRGTSHLSVAVAVVVAVVNEARQSAR